MSRAKQDLRRREGSTGETTEEMLAGEGRGG